MTSNRQPEKPSPDRLVSTNQDKAVYNQGSGSQPDRAEVAGGQSVDQSSPVAEVNRSTGGVAANRQFQPPPPVGNGAVSMTRESLTLLQKCAESELWVIPPEARQCLPSICADIAMDEAQPMRNRMKAADVLAKLDALNLAHQKATTPRVNVNVNLTDDARNAKLQAILGGQKLLPSANQSDAPATPAE